MGNKCWHVLCFCCIDKNKNLASKAELTALQAGDSKNEDETELEDFAEGFDMPVLSSCTGPTNVVVDNSDSFAYEI